MPTMHVITNEAGKIIAAMHGERGGNASLYPLAGQRMHRVEEVPVEIAGMVNPVEFHKAISAHFHAKGAKVTVVDTEANDLHPKQKHPRKKPA
ncbi:MAG: hypothetical protein HXX19_11520 [Rhodoferax sp.]|nr:hypothetical protein [Rhodoferax sp.]